MIWATCDPSSVVTSRCSNMPLRLTREMRALQNTTRKPFAKLPRQQEFRRDARLPKAICTETGKTPCRLFRRQEDARKIVERALEEPDVALRGCKDQGALDPGERVFRGMTRLRAASTGLFRKIGERVKPSCKDLLHPWLQGRRGQRQDSAKAGGFASGVKNHEFL